MNEPRLQHYIPRFYLSGFTDPRILSRANKETIWVYEQGQPIRRSSPKNEARQRDIYSFIENGVRNSSIEVWLGDLEAHVAPIISALASQPRAVTELEKEWLSLFMGTMHMRTPAERWLSETRVNPLVSKLMMEAAADPSKFRAFVEENHAEISDQDFDIEEMRRETLNGRADELAGRKDLEMHGMIQVGAKVGGLLSKMNWLAIHSETNDLFLTSDNPFISYVLDKASNNVYFRTGVGTNGVVVYFPLCRSLCLRISMDSMSGAGRAPGSDIRGINKMTMTCADRFVYAPEQSEKLKAVFDKKGGRVSVKTADLRFEGRKY